MSSATQTLNAKVWEDGSFAVAARVLGSDGELLRIATTATINYSVYDLDGPTPSVPTATGDLEPGEAIFDTLQTGAIWRRARPTDGKGYNFLHNASGALVPAGGHRYRIHYVFMDSDGGVGHAEVELTAKANAP